MQKIITKIIEKKIIIFLHSLTYKLTNNYIKIYCFLKINIEMAKQYNVCPAIIISECTPYTFLLVIDYNNGFGTYHTHISVIVQSLCIVI